MIFEVSKTDPGRARVVTNDGQSYEIDIKNVRHGFVYDTIRVPAGAIANGSRFEFFRDIQNKNDIDCNIKTQRRLSTGQKMVCTRVGVYVPKTFAETNTGILVAGGVQPIADESVLLENGYIEIKANSRLVTKGPAVNFPAGFGVQGVIGTNEDGTTPQFSSMHNGFPAGKLHTDLMVEQVIDDKTDIEAFIEYQARTWAGAPADIGTPTILGGSYTATSTIVKSCFIKLVLFGVIWGND